MIYVLFLGKQKQPSYCKGLDWNDRCTEGETNVMPYVEFFRLVDEDTFNNIRVGDGYQIDSHNLEVYGGKIFDDEWQFDEFLQSNCKKLYEI